MNDSQTRENPWDSSVLPAQDGGGVANSPSVKTIDGTSPDVTPSFEDRGQPQVLYLNSC